MALPPGSLLLFTMSRQSTHTFTRSVIRPREHHLGSMVDNCSINFQSTLTYLAWLARSIWPQHFVYLSIWSSATRVILDHKQSVYTRPPSLVNVCLIIHSLSLSTHTYQSTTIHCSNADTTNTWKCRSSTADPEHDSPASLLRGGENSTLDRYFHHTNNSTPLSTLHHFQCRYQRLQVLFRVLRDHCQDLLLHALSYLWHLLIVSEYCHSHCDDWLFRYWKLCPHASI